MKGLKTVVNASKNATNYPFNRVPLYYSIQEDKVSTEGLNDTYFLVTYMIRENTSDDVKSAVNRYLMM